MNMKENKFELGYSCQPDLRPLNVLLEHAVLAEKYEFESIWVSDHFHPWRHTRAHEGFTWVWIASALERTKKVKIGPSVTCPLFRYHPAIVAQAFASLEVLYPNRVFLGVGTGEAMNEVVLGYDWPNYKERASRLEEALQIINKLWNKEFVNFNGKYYKLRVANLYDKPKKPPPIYVAAFGPKSARIAGMYGDGLITTLIEEEFLKNKLFPEFEKGAKDKGKDIQLLKRIIELGISYDEDYEKALKACRFWAATLFPFMFRLPIYDPREIDKIADLVSDKVIANAFLITTELDDIVKKVIYLKQLGFDIVYIQSNSPDEERFIKKFGEKYIPYLKEELCRI
jgi:coenzyme F420-dependent glucose-6-phosphate dehydrogenase